LDKLKKRIVIVTTVVSIPVWASLFYWFSGYFVYFDDSAMKVERLWSVLKFHFDQTPLLVASEAFLYMVLTWGVVFILARRLIAKQDVRAKKT
jgi:hypothetical protein